MNTFTLTSRELNSSLETELKAALSSEGELKTEWAFS